MKHDIPELPEKPGVYLFYDSQGQVLYVGKAKSLKNRVKSYFREELDSPKTRALMRQFHHLQYMVTDTEKEALILENNLIKKHQPRYNIRLKDDKQYPYIKITDEDYPQVLLTRRVLDDGSHYYGPFTDTRSLRRMLKYINNLFLLRDCKRMDGPCLNYQMKICQGPCTGKISKEAYQKNVEKVDLLFQGRFLEILQILKREMEEAADKQEFEKAAVIRDQLQSIEEVLEKQKTEFTIQVDQDVVACSSEDDPMVVVVFSVREGKIIGKEDFLLEGSNEDSLAQILAAFLKQYYSGARQIPAEILLPQRIEDQQLIREWLEESRGDRVKLKIPQEGVEYRLLSMVKKNAQIIRQHQRRSLEALSDLKGYLNLSQVPRVVEAYDISNLAGKMAVGSLVVFEDGKPKKSRYRRYKIKTPGPDDYAMLREVLQRRYSKIEEDDLPDLVVVDGGAGQVNLAWEVFQSLDLTVPVIGLAKKFEEIHLPHLSTPLILPPNSPSLHLLQRIRDEAHRFAITYHKKLRSREIESSPLDGIPGVGPKRKLKLLKHFQNLENIRKASVEDISQVPGISEKLAQIIYQHLHPAG